MRQCCNNNNNLPNFAQAKEVNIVKIVFSLLESHF